MTDQLAIDLTLWDEGTAATPHGEGGHVAAVQPVAQDVLELVVYGIPAPQGSKKGFYNKKTGRVQMKESSEKVTPWREDVRHAALAYLEQHPMPPLDCALQVRMVFTLAKPASNPKTRRTWPQKYPDVSKLARSTEDALTSCGIWADDARVVDYDRLAKVFPGEDPESLDRPGVRITIRRVLA